MVAKVLSLVSIASWLFPLAGAVMAQQKEPRKIELNVFRIDAAVVAARARGFFAAEGIVLPVFVRPEIKSWSHLKGKKLAVDAVDTAFALVLRRILLAHGLDLNRGDYELVALGATGRRLESMMSGETFAGILNSPFDEKAAAAGMVRFGDHREVLPHYPGGILAANRGWAQSRREDLVGFLRGWLAGIRWVKNPGNREEAIKLVSADLKLSPKAATESVEELSPTGSLNLAGLQNVLDLRVQFGFKLPMGNSLDRYYDLSYFREAAGR